MKRDKRFRNIISTVSNFFVFFLLAAFVTTCCIMLFITALQGSIGRDFTREELSIAAKITLVNVVLISIVMAVIDYLRRKIMVDRPVRHITDAAEAITDEHTENTESTIQTASKTDNNLLFLLFIVCMGPFVVACECFVWHVGSSSLTGDRTWAPCIENTES